MEKELRLTKKMNLGIFSLFSWCRAFEESLLLCIKETNFQLFH